MCLFIMHLININYIDFQKSFQIKLNSRCEVNNEKYFEQIIDEFLKIKFKF